MLSEYLTLENQRVYIKDEKALAEEFKKKVINFFLDFNALDKNQYHQVIGATKEQINYNFVTFNYTDVLDTIISATQKNCSRYV